MIVRHSLSDMHTKSKSTIFKRIKEKARTGDFLFFQVGMTLCGIFTGIFVLKRAFTFLPGSLDGSWPNFFGSEWWSQRHIFVSPLNRKNPQFCSSFPQPPTASAFRFQLQAPDSLLHDPTSTSHNWHWQHHIPHAIPDSKSGPTLTWTSPKKVDFDYKRGIWNLNRNFNTPTTQKKKQKNNTVPSKTPQQDQDRQTKKSSRPRPRSIVFSAVVSRRSARFKKKKKS